MAPAPPRSMPTRYEMRGWSPAESNTYVRAGLTFTKIDPKTIDRLWNPFVAAWFEGGKSDPKLALLRFEPGVYTTAPFVHDHWEEVYLVSGDLTVGNDDKGNGGEPFKSPTYACRPPGVYHGPFKSNGGCLLYEIHYYDETRPFRQ